MLGTVIKAENISKQYRLGQVGTGTLSHDLNRWWHRMRGKEDPYLKVGEINDRTSKGQSNYVWALKDINFEVNQGEVLGIIGKNGAGKSTLLKILSKVTGPTTGCIKARGRIASLLEVGTGFHLELTGRENIYLNGTILGMSKAEVKAKLDEIVSFAGVERYLETPVKRYSSGMMVRLGFAVAAHLEPEILIVDEVLAVGDVEFQKKALGKIQEVSSEGGRTVLFVSHNLASVKNLCKKSILLEKGLIKNFSNTEQVIEMYLNRNKGLEHPYLNPDSFEIYNPNLLIKSIDFINDKLSITLNAKKAYSQIGVVCKIHSNEGVLLFKTSSTPIWSSKPYSLFGEETFILDLSKLPLLSGIYRLGIEVTIPDVKYLLQIEYADNITLQRSQIYQGNKAIKLGEDGYIFAPHKWIKMGGNED